MTSYKYDYELGARAYCKARGLDPDQHIMSAMDRAPAPRWKIIADRLREEHEHATASDEAWQAMTRAAQNTVLDEMRQMTPEQIHERAEATRRRARVEAG